MRKTPFVLPLLFLSGFLLPGCFTVPQHSYYVSPFNGNNEGYHALPLLKDSAHTAVYGGVSLFNGSANDYGNDHLSGGQITAHVAHHTGRMQFFYGLDLTLGSYSLGKWDSGYTGAFFRARTSPPMHADILNTYAGGKFFGGAGFSGGANYCLPFKDGEWRVWGVETSLHREFGDYLSFRRQLPDSVATFIVRNPFFGTVGWTTELIGQTRHGEFGFRLADGWVLGSDYKDNFVSGYRMHYHYFTLSFHYTYEQFTPYLQIGGGAKSSAIKLGLQVRLGRPRVAPLVRRGSAGMRGAR